VTLPEGLQRISDELSAHPAGEWVLRTYERFRPGSAEIGRESTALTA